MQQRIEKKYIPNYKRRGIQPIKMPPEEVSSVDHINVSDNQYNGHMIDNNNYIDLDATQSGSIETPSNDMEIGEYIILVDGKMLAKGNMQLMQQISTKLLYGDHPDFDGALDIDDIVILKRVGLKFGVFINE